MVHLRLTLGLVKASNLRFFFKSKRQGQFRLVVLSGLGHQGALEPSCDFVGCGVGVVCLGKGASNN